ncbi:hypothetical protein [Microbacterium sp. BH-3-3-3]|uniref:hypothetical protein n=1 Tax=Microbacterium sp. BH-3-3-3 TaxID=1906742 RepID=UPI0011A19A24|nr:hypothetical protein [Microbacterium sp. BH-3-3-3]
MSLKDRIPVERTTAQLFIIVGAMILFAGLIFLTIFVAIGDPHVANRAGIPLWFSTTVTICLGAAVITVGALLYPRK